MKEKSLRTVQWDGGQLIMTNLCFFLLQPEVNLQPLSPRYVSHNVANAVCPSNTSLVGTVYPALLTALNVQVHSSLAASANAYLW
jgi:hypothetical protein